MRITILPHPSKTALFLFGAGAVALLLALYIVQVNALTAVVWKTGEQEQKLKILRGEVRGLEVQHLKSVSRDNMEQLAQELNFVRVGEVSYLRALPSTVAASGVSAE